MSDAPANPLSEAAHAEVRRLRATLTTAHDHLHHDRVNEAHEALHCAGAGKAAEAAHITADDGARVHEFIEAFNSLCAGMAMPAAAIVLVPSKTHADHVSVQIGGHVPTIQFIRRAMGYGETRAAR